jgi:hypothetical protein
MSEFQKYQHVERFGHQEVQGIEDGACHVFPKIDGTNASVWWEDDQLQAGSRRRHLTPADDNHGFCTWAYQQDNLIEFLGDYPTYRVYGEWLVPHSLKTYRDDAWRRFYIFDVVDTETGNYLPYEVYQPILEWRGLDYIPCVAIVRNGSEAKFQALAEKNDFLMQPGQIGEGIVIKRYDFQNRYGRVVWAKIVRSEFKEKNHKEFGPTLILGQEDIETKIVMTAVTKTLVEKERAKIENDLDAEATRTGKMPPIQPRLLQTVFYCVVTEELWECLKKLKNPTVDFKRLQRLVTSRTKELAKDLF